MTFVDTSPSATKTPRTWGHNTISSTGPHVLACVSDSPRIQRFWPSTRFQRLLLQKSVSLSPAVGTMQAAGDEERLLDHVPFQDRAPLQEPIPILE